MARFQFRFGPVLRQRQATEDHCQRELAILLRKRHIWQSQLRSVQRAISQSKRNLADGLVASVDLNRVAQFARYSGQGTQRAQQIVMRMSGLEKQIEQVRGQLLDATLARRTMELLWQRHHEKWRAEQRRREADEMDELALQQYVRNASVEIST